MSLRPSLRFPVALMACVAAILGAVISIYSGGTLGKALIFGVLSGATNGLFAYRLLTLDERLRRPRGLDRT